MALKGIASQAGPILWPMGGVVSGSLLIAWGTEVLAFFLSRGLAFALLAFFQVLPEFAVEAVITYQAADPLNPEGLALVSANFTGANRLIVGLFLPMVFFLAARAQRRRTGVTPDAIEMPQESSVEIMALVVATGYSFIIPIKGSLDLYDSVVLAAIYCTYLWVLWRLPPHGEDETALPRVPRKVRSFPIRVQKLLIVAFFVVGGGLLLFSVGPFYHNTIELGALLGITVYFLFQWMAPFLSEFPEFIALFYWGRTGRGQMGLTNAVSAKVNQWTLLLAMIPIVYLWATWHFTGTADPHLNFVGAGGDVQRVEILVTAAQGLFAAACLANLRFERWEAMALLLLWAIQLLDPVLDPIIHEDLPGLAISPFGTGAYIREWFVLVYIALTGYVLWRARGKLAAVTGFREVWRRHVGTRPTLGHAR